MNNIKRAEVLTTIVMCVTIPALWLIATYISKMDLAKSRNLCITEECYRYSVYTNCSIWSSWRVCAQNKLDYLNDVIDGLVQENIKLKNQLNGLMLNKTV